MRVIVVNQSEQVRQLLQYVFENGIDVEVVLETDETATLPEQVERLKPDSLFLLQDEYTKRNSVIKRILAASPGLQVILLSADGHHIRFQQDGRNAEVESWPEYTLSDFIYHLSTEGPPKESIATDSIIDGPEKARKADSV
jgi:chemotaxis response regulator CheB